MNSRLAGYNILLVEKSKTEASSMAEALKSFGGNVFVATEHVQCVALQHRWDIDLIISEVSFLTGMGEVMAQNTEPRPGKSSPLLFVYGSQMSLHPQTISSRGVLRFFTLPMDIKYVVDSIAAYLYDPKNHLKQLSESPNNTHISFILQNGQGTWELDVSEFSDEGLVSNLSMGKSLSETASLTVIIPGLSVMRFSVRLEFKSDETGIVKIKLLMRDRDRWKGLISLLNNRQNEINEFLLASSGK